MANSARIDRRSDWRVTAPALLLLAAGALYIADGASGRMAWLYLLGAALGLVLYHAAFGFASAWRVFIAEGRGEGLRAQMVMLGLASLLFFPLIDQGSFFGQPVGGGAVAPLGVSVAVGAAIFGVGMQLAGGCASGTLYTVGGGSTHMVFTLIFFMIGSVIGTAHMPWWIETASWGSISILREWGLFQALAAQLALLAAIAAFTLWVERRLRPAETGEATERRGESPGWRRFVSGPWPLLWGAVALAVLNAVTLVYAGHPWTISFGYTLWGGKLASAAGIDLSAWAFWTWPFPSRALAGSVFENSTSVMNFGVIIGALLAAGLAGRFNPAWRLPWRKVLAAAIGGLLMGYGARLAYGCNVGAYFSGVASGSLHGWLWFAAALGGSYLGNVLRPYFGLQGGFSRRAVPQAA
ncbi:YeeE/YedE family protein [Pelagibius litoralis]|uniref:YeeE/YedE family protein n=1 Tax=Pelagibius litoralis TaxID=374515 RepID=A0A967F0I0_9PROT|nr:YeeE/YedE family protein [Pelagibius litoralis]NIA70757.1 YeeE/YedE family protein [Pelagibius litoralis]